MTETVPEPLLAAYSFLLSGVNVNHMASYPTGTYPRNLRSGSEYAYTQLSILESTQTLLLSGATARPCDGTPCGPPSGPGMPMTLPPAHGVSIRRISLWVAKSTTTKPLIRLRV